MIPVILAGGKGERFWPLSRSHRPKQFLSLDGSGKSLLQATAERLLPLAQSWDRLWVITAAPIAAQVTAQLPDLPVANVLVEPQGRDTAAAVAWGTLTIAQHYGEETVVGFFPADHWIGNPEGFQQTLHAACQLVLQKRAIATLGIQPTYPATGYGYIEQGDLAGMFNTLAAYRVSQFTEKPDREKAEGFLASGRFSWNSGMFIFQAGVALQELRLHARDLVHQLETQGVGAYGHLPKISIDYALMEKTHQAYVLPADFGWDDLGDWNAIARLHSKDNTHKDNTNVELATHQGFDTHRSLIFAENPDERIITLGLEDTIVVRDGNVTLIVRKDRTQEIKTVLKALQQDDRFKDLI